MELVEIAQRKLRETKEQISAEEEGLLRAQRDLRRLKRERRCEKYLLGQLRGVQQSHVGLRIMQAEINIRKGFSDQIRDLGNEICRRKRSIYELSRTQELTEDLIALQSEENKQGQSQTQQKLVLFSKDQLLAILPRLAEDTKFTIVE